MAESIINGTQFNANQIKYSAPKANASGGKSVNILNVKSSTWLTISTPLMLTWGAGDFVDPNTGAGNGKFELALQFPNDDKNEETDLFLKNMQELENKIVSDALNVHSKDWFGKIHKSEDVIRALWTPMLKYSKNKNTGEPDLTKAPTLKLKLPMWEGVWKSEIYDEDGDKLFPNTNTAITPLDYLKKGAMIMTVMQCGGLWFANGKFGVTWKLVQAGVQKPRASLQGSCFLTFKKSDKDKLKAQVVPEIELSTHVDDSDEEDDDIHQSQPDAQEDIQTTVAEQVATEITTIAEPEKKKKVVRKKTAATDDD
jgi:hypothetical protein